MHAKGGQLGTCGLLLCRRTLQPHLFIFTACEVKAGREALLDYGKVRTSMTSPLKMCSAENAAESVNIAIMPSDEPALRASGR